MSTPEHPTIGQFMRAFSEAMNGAVESSPFLQALIAQERRQRLALAQVMAQAEREHRRENGRRFYRLARKLRRAAR